MSNGDYLEIEVTQADLSSISNQEIDRMWDLIEAGQRSGTITKVERDWEPYFSRCRLRLYGNLQQIQTLISQALPSDVDSQRSGKF